MLPIELQSLSIRNKSRRQNCRIYRSETNLADRTAKSIDPQPILSIEPQDLSARNQSCRQNRKIYRSETYLVDRTAKSIGQQPILSIEPQDLSLSNQSCRQNRQNLSIRNLSCRWNRKIYRSATNLVDRTAKSIGQQPILPTELQNLSVSNQSCR
jgi:hypothetical protein